jgi:hypothetical protein
MRLWWIFPAIRNKIIVLYTTLGRIILPYITLLIPARKCQIISSNHRFCYTPSTQDFKYNQVSSLDMVAAMITTCTELCQFSVMTGRYFRKWSPITNRLGSAFVQMLSWRKRDTLQSEVCLKKANIETRTHGDDSQQNTFKLGYAYDSFAFGRVKQTCHPVSWRLSSLQKSRYFSRQLLI